MKQFFVKLRSDKPFRCSVGILLCTLISGILNPVYRYLSQRNMEYHNENLVEQFAPVLLIGMIVCCSCFFVPAWNAVRCGYHNEYGVSFQEYMKSIMITAIAWAIIAGFCGLSITAIFIFLAVDTGIVIMVPFLVVCGINGILAKNALNTIKNQQ